MKIAIMHGALILLLAAERLVLAESVPQEIRGIDACDPLQNSHVIFRATVLERQITRMTAAEFGLVPSGSASAHEQLSVTRIRVSISEVLKGKLRENETTMISRGGSSLFEVNKEYIICALRRGPRESEFLLTGASIGFYRRADDRKQWVKCQPRDLTGEASVSDKELRSRIERGNLKAVTRDCDVIVRGVITNANETEYVNELGQQGRLIRYEVEVRERLKGDISGSVIHFVVPLPGAAQAPHWYRCVPEEIGIGQEWLVFLRKGNDGLYPFAGRNSLLKVEAHRLVYDTRAEFAHSMRDARELIRTETSYDQN